MTFTIHLNIPFSIDVNVLSSTLCRKRKKNKDKKRKRDDGKDKPDIVGMCVRARLRAMCTLLSIGSSNICSACVFGKT